MEDDNITAEMLKIETATVEEAFCVLMNKWGKNPRSLAE